MRTILNVELNSIKCDVFMWHFAISSCVKTVIIKVPLIIKIVNFECANYG